MQAEEQAASAASRNGSQRHLAGRLSHWVACDAERAACNEHCHRLESGVNTVRLQLSARTPQERQAAQQHGSCDSQPDAGVPAEWVSCLYSSLEFKVRLC